MIQLVSKRAAWAALAVVAVLVIAACGGGTSTSSPQSFKGTKKIGGSFTISGQSQLYGHAKSQAVKMAVDDINAKGGVNQYKLEASILDDGTDVSKSKENTQSLILQEQVVALIGSVTSAQCVANTLVSRQNKTLTIAPTCNSWQLTAQPDLINPYWVSIVPNTYMEGVAAGQLAAKLGVKKIFIVSPRYIFGTSETNAFVAALKKAAPSVQFQFNPESQWYVPFPTQPRWDSTISSIQAFKPDLVYSNIFAADQVNFVTQALAVDPNFFKSYPMTTLSSVDDLNALGAKYPIGMHLYMRAPFFALSNPKMDDFVSRYKARYGGEYPSDWAVMDYDAVMTYATAANAAKSFDSDKVRAQIVGKSFDSLRGYKYTIRAIDQQANVGETIGTTADSGGKYPFPLLKDITNLKGDDMIMPENMVQEMKDGKCQKTAGDPTSTDFALCPSWKKS